MAPDVHAVAQYARQVNEWTPATTPPGVLRGLVPIVAWLAGFVAYQLIYPGDIPGWSAMWAGLASALGFVAPGWLGSSVGAILVSGAVMAGLGQLERRRG